MSIFIAIIIIIININNTTMRSKNFIIYFLFGIISHLPINQNHECQNPNQESHNIVIENSNTRISYDIINLTIIINN